MSRPRKQRIPKDIGLSSRFGTQSATAKRGAHFAKSPPKNLASAISRVKLAKLSAKLVANFRRSLEGDFRASFAVENRQKHLPPKLHRKFHHRTSLRGSGLWRAQKNPLLLVPDKLGLSFPDSGAILEYSGAEVLKGVLLGPCL